MDHVSYWGTWAIYWPTSWLTVSHYVGRYIGWVSVKSWSKHQPGSVLLSAEDQSSVGKQIDGLSLWWHWWGVGNVWMNHQQRMGKVLVVYQLSIGIDCTIFFPTSSLRLFPLLQGTCQLTRGRHYHQIMRYFHVSAWHLGCLSVDVSVFISERVSGKCQLRVNQGISCQINQVLVYDLSVICWQVTADYRLTADRQTVVVNYWDSTQHKMLISMIMRALEKS